MGEDAESFIGWWLCLLDIPTADQVIVCTPVPFCGSSSGRSCLTTGYINVEPLWEEIMLWLLTTNAQAYAPVAVNAGHSPAFSNVRDQT